ncbi:hypothetical protein Nepgr_006572 [Nepenthes gracilis]|uniref:Uncharacterized protein n=1 Tax=Nepenthes gracilis TaxID=150966 RepID=A0AAD3S5A3_NEPGR|nr:hypothetical protein Nepgr_006572 [Nepenthes gracilis]
MPPDVSGHDFVQALSTMYPDYGALDSFAVSRNFAAAFQLESLPRLRLLILYCLAHWNVEYSAEVEVFSLVDRESWSMRMLDSYCCEVGGYLCLQFCNCLVGRVGFLCSVRLQNFCGVENTSMMQLVYGYALFFGLSLIKCICCCGDGHIAEMDGFWVGLDGPLSADISGSFVRFWLHYGSALWWFGLRCVIDFLFDGPHQAAQFGRQRLVCEGSLCLGMESISLIGWSS